MGDNRIVCPSCGFRFGLDPEPVRPTCGCPGHHPRRAVVAPPGGCLKSGPTPPTVDPDAFDRALDESLRVLQEQEERVFGGCAFHDAIGGEDVP